MKFSNVSKLFTVLTAATIFGLFYVNQLAADTVYKIIGLTPNNTLVLYGQDSRNSGTPVRVTGIDGNLQGIDFRPANGRLYGVTDTDKIYTINPDSGAATFVSTLSTSFNGGFQSGFDFNPVVDRLRIVGSNDQNLRTNVDTGAVTVDTALAYATGDTNAGIDPNITAAAYINSRAGVTSTALYGIDYDRDVLVLQNPPNSGTLNTVGRLGINFAPIGGFDIFTNSNGENTAFAVSGSSLYNINLTTGAAMRMGSMPSGGFIGLAVTVSQRRS